MKIGDNKLNEVVGSIVKGEADKTKRDCAAIRVEEGVDEDTVEVDIRDNELNEVVELTVSVEDDETM